MLLDVLFAVALAGAAVQDKPEEIPWSPGKADLDPAATALRHDKPLVAWFTAPADVKCRKLEDEILKDRAIAEQARHYVWIRIDLPDGPAVAAARKSGGVVGLPTLRIYSRTGVKTGEFIFSANRAAVAAVLQETRIRAIPAGEKPAPDRPEDTHLARLRNGNVVDGRLIEVTDTVVVMEFVPGAQIKIPRGDIVSIEWVRIRRQGEEAKRVGLQEPPPVPPPQPPPPRVETPPDAGPQEPVPADRAQAFVEGLILRYRTDRNAAVFKIHLVKAGPAALAYAAAQVPQDGEIDELVIHAIEGASSQEACRALLPQLQSLSSPTVLAGAIRALAESGLTQGLRQVQSYKDHADGRVRAAVVQYLARCGDLSSLPALCAAVIDLDAVVRARAVPATMAAVERLGKQDDVIPRLSRLMNLRPDSRYDQVPALLKLLRKPAGVELLVRCLSFKDGKVRAGAVEALAETATREEAEGTLLALFGSELDPEVLLKVCAAASRLRMRKGVAPMIELLKTEESTPLGKAAVQALVDLTGVRFPAHHPSWSRWYEANRASFERGE